MAWSGIIEWAVLKGYYREVRKDIAGLSERVLPDYLFRFVQFRVSGNR